MALSVISNDLVRERELTTKGRDITVEAAVWNDTRKGSTARVQETSKS